MQQLFFLLKDSDGGFNCSEGISGKDSSCCIFLDICCDKFTVAAGCAIECLEERISRYVVPEKYLSAYGFSFAEHRDDDVFRADLVRLHAGSLDLCEFENLLCPCRELEGSA